MADPTQLQGQIYQSYGKGVTGYQPEQVQEALRRDQNIRQENLKSLYDVTADLDAAAMSSIQSELDDIYKKIDSNELNLRSPQFAAAQSKLNSTAVGLKEVQNMAQQVLADAAKNPENVSYIVTDEFGRPKDLGYRGLVEAMTNFSSGQYGRPEEYIGAGSAALSGVDAQIDENELQTDIRKSVDADVENYIRSKGLSEKEIQTQMYAYRTGARSIVDQMPKEVRQQIADQNYRRFQNDLRSQFATANAREGYGQEVTEQGWGKEYIDEFIPEAVVDTKDITVPRYIPNDSETNAGLRRTGNGKYENEDFSFVVVDTPTKRERSSIRGQRKGTLSGKLNVVPKAKGEPLRSFTIGMGEDAEKISGRLTDIKIENGEPILVVRTANDDFEEMPIGENFSVLEEFYGITEQDIRSMISQMQEGSRLSTSTPKGTTNKKKLPGT